MGLFSKLSEKRMKDPVEGTVRVVGITTPNPNATQENYRLDGVVSGPGIEPTAIIHKGFTNVSKWPYVGQELPVTVDRADPTHISIHWDRLSTSHEIAQQQTEALAAQMRGQQPAGGAPGAAAPGFGDPSAIVSRIDASIQQRLAVLSDLKGAHVGIDAGDDDLRLVFTATPASPSGPASQALGAIHLGNVAPLRAVSRDAGFALLVRGARRRLDARMERD